MTMADVEMLADSWKEAPPLAECVRAALGVKPPETATGTQSPKKTDLTKAEYDDMLAAMKGNAEAYGRRRN